MFYVIQQNLFREYGFKALIHHLEKNGLGYEIVKYIPFSNELQVKTERKDVFFFGSINGGKVAEKYGWNPGHLINENFTFEVYVEKYGDNLLNHPSFICTARESQEGIIEFADEFFARPVTDTKEFTGDVFSKDGWLDYIKDNDIVSDLKVLFSSPKNIQQEIRCWIVNSEPITISQYKIGKRANYLNMDNNEEAILFARQMAKIYSPAKAYCLDICLHDDEYKIVEIGCINHCGFYDANMSKIIQALENSF